MFCQSEAVDSTLCTYTVAHSAYDAGSRVSCPLLIFEGTRFTRNAYADVQAKHLCTEKENKDKKKKKPETTNKQQQNPARAYLGLSLKMLIAWNLVPTLS